MGVRLPGPSWARVRWVRLDEHPTVVRMTEPTGLVLVELGAVNEDGTPTGMGNLALTLGHLGPEPHGSVFSLSDGAAVTYGSIVGQAPGPILDAHGGPPVAALGILRPAGKVMDSALGAVIEAEKGTLWLRRGRWRPGERVPPRAPVRRRSRRLPPIAGGAGHTDPPNHSPMVEQSGRTGSWGGQYQAGAAASLASLSARRPPWW